MMESASVAGAVARHSARFRPTERLQVLLDRCRIEVRTNSPDLAARLRSYLREFLCQNGEPDIEILALEAPVHPPPAPLAARPAEPGKERIKEEFIDLPDGRLVRKRLTGMLFYFGGGRHLALGPCLANDNQVVNFLNSRYIQWLLDRGALLCHAGAVARGERGVLLAGASGTGKSTLALQLLARGCDYLSNDRVLLRREGAGVRLLGVPKLPRVNPGTLLGVPGLAATLAPSDRARYSALPAAELRSLEHKHDVDVAALFGSGRMALSARLEAALVLAWRFDAGPPRLERVELARRPDLLESLMKPVGLFYEPDPAERPADFSPRRYLECLAGVPVLCLSGGVDFEAAAELLEARVFPAPEVHPEPGRPGEGPGREAADRAESPDGS